MKKLLTFLVMSILAIGVGWAETVTFSYTGNGQAVQSSNGITITISKGTSSTDPATNTYSGAHFRIYKDNDIEIDAGSYTIESVVFTCVSGYASYWESDYATYGDISVSGSTVTLSDVNASSTIIHHSGNATRITQAVVTYSVGASTVGTPTFSPAAGTYFEAQNVTLSCATTGATIRYTTDGTEPSATTGTVYTEPFTISSTTTIKAIATANGYNPSSIATATYIISDPPEVSLNYSNTLLNGHENFYVVDRAKGGLSKVWNDSQYGITANGLNRTSEVESYLYSPVFDATSMRGYTISLDFEENVRYFATDALSASQATLWVREGTTGDWQQLTITPTHANADNNDFHGINTIDLSAYAGKKFQLAFKYLADMENDPGRWEIKNFSITATKAASSDLYILGMINGNGEYPTRAVKMEYDGNNYTAKIWVIGNSSNAMGVPGSWMAFTTVLAENNDTGGWGYVNSNRYSPSPDNGNYYWLTNGTESDIPLTKQNNDKAFLIPAGLYEITVSGDLSKFSLNTIKNLTPTINPNGGEVNQYSTATVSIIEDFNAFIDDCNEVVYANGTTVNDITAPVAKFYLNNELVNGTSTSYQFNTTGSVTLTGKCTLVSGEVEYATKTATANFTVNEVTLEGDEYALVTNITELNENDYYIIASKDAGIAMAEQNNNNRAGKAVTMIENGNKATIGDNIEVFLLEQGASGWYFKATKINEGYLYAASSTSNHLKTHDGQENSEAVITIASDGSATVVFNSTNRNHLRYNPNNDSPIFTCYAENSSIKNPVYLYKKTSSVTPSNKVATPVISPASATTDPYTVYGGLQEITITCATDGAAIYYTTDNSTPTTSSNLYSAPFELTSTGGNMTVKAIAVKQDLDDSEVASANYLFKSPVAPTFTPASSTQTEDFIVTINSEYEDGVIYYMLDPENEPTANNLKEYGTVYDQGFTVSGTGTHTVYAIVERYGMKSAVASKTYTITSGGTTGDGEYVKVTSNTDLTDGEYLIVYEGDNNHNPVAFNGALENLDATPNTISVEINNFTIPSNATVDAAVFIFDSTEGTFMNESGVYIGRTSDANGLESGTTALTNTVSIDNDGNAVIISNGGAYLRYNASSNQEKFRYFKSSTYESQKSIALYKKTTAVVIEPVVLDGVAFTADRQWATWYGDANLALPEKVAAYVVTGVQGDAVAVEALDYIPANTGVLLNRETAAESVSAMPYTGEAGTIPTSLLVGSLEAQTVSNAYLLYNNQFILAQDGTTVGAHRCYLPMSASAHGVPVLKIGAPGTVTGVETINTNNNGDNTYYNLMGQPVTNPAPGIYIRGGKKVIVK